jgi:hypothetical protein
MKIKRYRKADATAVNVKQNASGRYLVSIKTEFQIREEKPL